MDAADQMFVEKHRAIKQQRVTYNNKTRGRMTEVSNLPQERKLTVAEEIYILSSVRCQDKCTCREKVQFGNGCLAVPYPSMRDHQCPYALNVKQSSECLLLHT